jgi:hypothetical protein
MVAALQPSPTNRSSKAAAGSIESRTLREDFPFVI